MQSAHADGKNIIAHLVDNVDCSIEDVSIAIQLSLGGATVTLDLDQTSRVMKPPHKQQISDQASLSLRSVQQNKRCLGNHVRRKHRKASPAKGNRPEEAIEITSSDNDFDRPVHTTPHPPNSILFPDTPVSASNERGAWLTTPPKVETAGRGQAWVFVNRPEGHTVASRIRIKPSVLGQSCPLFSIELMEVAVCVNDMKADHEGYQARSSTHEVPAGHQLVVHRKCE